MGVQTPEYMAPIGQLIETLDQWPQIAIIAVGRETSPRGSCLTWQPIKNYGQALHVLGRGGAPPLFSLTGEPPDNILILC